VGNEVDKLFESYYLADIKFREYRKELDQEVSGEEKQELKTRFEDMSRTFNELKSRVEGIVEGEDSEPFRTEVHTQFQNQSAEIARLQQEVNALKSTIENFSKNLFIQVEFGIE